MEEQKKNKIYTIILVIVISAFITFMITSIGLYTYFKNNPIKISSSESGNSIEGIANSLKIYESIIDNYYLGEINEEKLKEGAIKGYIQGIGDPYTEFISKEEMEEYMIDTMGNYVGIGIYMIKNTNYDRIQVLCTIKGTPAEEAGIQSGDFIYKINGTEYKADDMTAVSNLIKGEEGTTLKLEIIRKNEIKEYELTRRIVKMNQVYGKVISNNIGYIEFSSFDETTANDFKIKYEELSKQGIKSLIIDLRNNGGGIVDQALEIADYILKKDDVILYEVDKNNNEIIKKSNNDPIIEIPIVILVNENTASASEILAGALKDHSKAKIVGKTTYGKGIIQQILKLSDGSGLKITTEEYLTPNRNKINKIGIEPDEIVELPENITNISDIDESDDTQLQKAIELLK